MRESRIVVLTATAALVLAVIACGDDDAGHGTLTVSDVWARASAGSQATGAVYFTIVGGATSDVLVGMAVAPAVAAGVALHETVETAGTTMAGHEMGGTTMPGHEMGGGLTMRAVSDVVVPAGDTVVFEPGGYHIMLLGLVEPLVAGETFEVALLFERAGEVVVTVEVRE